MIIARDSRRARARVLFILAFWSAAHALICTVQAHFEKIKKKKTLARKTKWKNKLNIYYRRYIRFDVKRYCDYIIRIIIIVIIIIFHRRRRAPSRRRRLYVCASRETTTTK